MNIPELYDVYIKHTVITTDSRKITPGCMFFALKGETFNGNAFANAAIEAGAAFSVVDEDIQGNNDRIIKVDDVLDTLSQLAIHHRKQFSIPFIGITGTNGKTTTKELIFTVLSSHYKTAATSGNLNNHIGVPLTILSIHPDTEIAIIEMGANHQKEIEQLCKIAMPTHGIITNIGKAHLEGFGGYEGVIKAKTELYTYIKGTNGKVFVNSDDQLLMDHSEGLDRITYGNNLTSTAEAAEVMADPYLRMNLKLEEEHQLQTNLFGLFNLPNVLAACAIGRHFQVPEEKIVSSLASYVPVNNRSQIVQSGSNRLFLDAYNANPSSMEQAIRNFAALPGSNKVYILGDMLELGDESEKEHDQILKILEELNAQEVYLVGPVFLQVNTKIKWMNFQDSDLAAMWFDHHRIKDADILVKGSRGIRMEKVVQYL